MSNILCIQTTDQALLERLDCSPVDVTGSSIHAEAIRHHSTSAEDWYDVAGWKQWGATQGPMCIHRVVEKLCEQKDAATFSALHSELEALCERSTMVVLWYSSDFHDVDVVSTGEAFASLVTEQIAAGKYGDGFELYGVFRREASRHQQGVEQQNLFAR